MSWSEAKFDFNFGYISTTVLALLFVMLGALVMYGSGASFSSSGGAFAAQVVSLYTENLGLWSKPLIAFAAFSTMFSTTLTCLDAYPRSLNAATGLIWQRWQRNDRKVYFFWLAWCVAGGLLVIFFLISSLQTLVDFVTTAAFLTAPIFAFMNYKLIFSEHLPQNFAPSNRYRIFCWLGLVYLFGFSIFYLMTRY